MFHGESRFEWTIVEGADFTDIELREDIRAKLCQSAKGVNPVTHRSTRETLLCDE